MATMFGKKIRIFVGSKRVEEITPAEPVYPDDSQEVCVWTDLTAWHDSELINLNYFVRIAQSISYERRFWELFDDNIWLSQWSDKFAEYEKAWLYR